MNPLIPVLSAIAQASSIVLDKTIISIKKVTYKTYTGISFPLILLINFIFFLIFSPTISISIFSAKFFLLITIASIISIIGNILFYKALKKDLLNEMETLSLLGTIPLILLSAIIFPSERASITIIILALVSSIAIIWSHWKGRHFQIAKTTLVFLLFTILISPLRGIVSKILLVNLDSISFNLFTTILPALFFSFYFIKSEKNITKKAFFLLLATNILTTTAWILYFLSYKEFGIIYTVLIFSLQPLLVYFTSIFVLKEKLHWKKFTAFIIILICIILAQII